MAAGKGKSGWIWGFCVAAVILVVLSGLITRAASGLMPTRQEKITAMVIENLDALETAADTFLSGEAAAPFGVKCTATVESLSDGGTFVSFQTDADGAGSQMSYYGFYRSPEGMVDFADYTLAEVKDGGVGLKTAAGDNWFYTEHITGDWYYYEQHF